jgi:hypothetical protein
MKRRGGWGPDPLPKPGVLVGAVGPVTVPGGDAEPVGQAAAPGEGWLIGWPSLMKCSLIQPLPEPGPPAQLASSHMLSVDPGTFAAPA